MLYLYGKTPRPKAEFEFDIFLNQIIVDIISFQILILSIITYLSD